MPRVLTLLLALHAGATLAAPPEAGAALFAKVKKLEGTWKSERADGSTYAAFKVVGNGGAVLLTLTDADRTKVQRATVFFLEGADLYASQVGGPAPMLRLKARQDGETLYFDWQPKDAKDPRPAGVVTLSLALKDASVIAHGTVVSDGAKDSASMVLLTREAMEVLR